MPRFILKRSPDADEYLEWSTVVDAPVSEVMTREEMTEHLFARGFELMHSVEERLARADENGSSALPHVDDGYVNGGWDSDLLWWREGNPAGFGILMVEHEELFAAVRGAEP